MQCNEVQHDFKKSVIEELPKCDTWTHNWGLSCFLGDGKQYFEGDIILDEHDKMRITRQSNGISEMEDTSLNKRNAKLDRHRLWTDSTVLFAISPPVGG